MTVTTPRPAHVTAREIVTDPAFADQPAILATAWAALMEARGCRVDLDRIARPDHLIDRTGACADVDAFTAGRARRIRDRIRAHAAAIGITRPPPLILRDAIAPVTSRTRQ